MSAQEKKLSVVIVGAGDMGGKHCAGWKDAGCEVVGVADLDEERLEAFRKEHGIAESGSDYRKVIDAVKPDVVSVCVPVCLHREVTVYAAEAGCHVLCEKPIALTVEDARVMIDACERAGRLLCIGFQRRYEGGTGAFKRLVGNGALGRPVIWKAMDLREVRPKILMHSRSGNGGSIIDCGVHAFDQWRYVFDSEPVSVYACGGCFGEGKERLAAVGDKAVDTGVITVKFASGDVGELTLGWGLPEETPGKTNEMLIGPEGRTRSAEGGVEAVSGKNILKEETNGEGRPNMIKDFVSAIATNGASPISGHDGVAALKVALAAVESIETGRLVEMEM
jgi:predicted dehydrogenase